MLTDLRYGLRLMMRRPGFAALAVFTLALGIGTNAAIFAVTDRVLLRPVPYPDFDRLVVGWETSPDIPLPVMSVSPPNLYEWQRRSRSYEHIGGFQWRSVTLGGLEPEQVRGARVTAGFMRALGVQPQLGRLFLDEEDRAKARAVVLLSDGFWQRKFNRDPNILGRAIEIDGVRSEIVGVMPADYVCPPAVVLRGSPPADRAELWVPHGTNLEEGQRGAHYLIVIGRLKPGVTRDAAERELVDIQTQIEREFPGYRDWRAVVTPLTEEVTASSERAVRLLIAAVLFVLLLACANVANLLLARGVGRRREFAVRAALGAGRARLAIQVIAESVTLAAAGGIAGYAIAAVLVRLITLLGPASTPGLQDARIDARTIAFVIGVSIVAAILTGALPAVAVARTRLSTWLADRTGGPGAGTARAQRLLAIGQIGLAVALLATAALLVESFRQLRAVDPGFRPDHVITAKVTLPASRYPDAASRARFVDSMLERVGQLPSARSIGIIDAVPIADNRQGTEFTRLDGPPADPSGVPTANVAWITEGYFESMGIPLIAGRTFTARDTRDSERVVIINRRLARQVFGSEDPLGRQVRVGSSTQAPFQIVGVVGDERHVGVEAEATPSFFLAYRQVPNVRDLAFVIRTADTAAPRASAFRSFLGPLAGVVSDAMSRQNTLSTLRLVLKSVDPDLPLFQVRTMEQVVDAAVATPRSIAWLLSTFAAAALLLAAIGVFGVLSHAVSHRTREIGVRMAIGASPSSVLTMVLREGLTQVALGVGVGIVLSLVTSRLVSGLLFGVTTSSPTPYIVVSVVLLVAALAASAIPARRAMRVDPATALRAD